MCRSQGLEVRRRCGWLAEAAAQPEKVIWARHGARSTECPTSFITAESLSWIERYQVARVFGFGDPMELPAREGSGVWIFWSKLGDHFVERAHSEVVRIPSRNAVADPKQLRDIPADAADQFRRGG